MLPMRSSTHRFILKWLCVAILSALLVYFCYRHTLAAPDALKWNAWAFSDWLINYSGGFVRHSLAVNGSASPQRASRRRRSST